MSADMLPIQVCDSVESVVCEVGREWLDTYDLDAGRYRVSAQLYLMSRFPTAPGGVSVNVIPGKRRPTVTLIQTGLYREVEQCLANL